MSRKDCPPAREARAPRAKPPRVVIVGAPNVGKSTLFNRLTGRKRSLVHAQPGMTRDRLTAPAELEGLTVELTDTGGVLEQPPDDLGRAIARQAMRALQDADLVLLVTDGRLGLAPRDRQVADLVRRAGRSGIVVVNKLDTPALESAAAEFHALGMDDVVALSAEHGGGVGELTSRIVTFLGPRPHPRSAGDEEIRVALIGRPNVGKSSLLNRLLNDDRVLVSDQPGTTRDPVDTLLIAHRRRFRLVDTAGLRRRHRSAGEQEGLAIRQAHEAMKRAAVVVLVLDAVTGLTTGDIAIAADAMAAGRAVVPVLNKWDALVGREEASRQFRREVSRRLKFLPHGGLLTVSARTGLRVRRVLSEALRSHAELIAWRPTPSWNRALAAALAARRTPVVEGRPFRFYYAVQTAVAPPTVELFVNSNRHLPEAYRRFLESRLRRELGLSRVPVRLVLRAKRAAGGRRRRP